MNQKNIKMKIMIIKIKSTHFKNNFRIAAIITSIYKKQILNYSRSKKSI